ncbi:hypothetical protein IJG72_06520 [bacterium]|nr:hypothetical protein [bacterium]
MTALWKNGELLKGAYYCNTGNQIEILYTWCKKYNQLTNNKDEVYIPEMDDCKIIASVPSYEEWQALNQNLDSTMQTNKALYKKLAEVKELLKEIRSSIAESQLKLTPKGFKLITEIVAKIDEVLK